MKQITWQSATAFLLDVPDFSGSYSLTVSIPTYIDRGITGREAREQTGDTPRILLSFTATLQTQAEVVETRNALQNLTTQPVLCPLWVAKRALGESHPVSSGWWAVYEPDVSPVVYDTASLPLTVADGTWVVPLMVGILADPPTPESINSEAASVSFKFVENSDLFLSFAAFTASNGPTAGGGVTPTLFPFREDWSTRPKGSGAQFPITRSKVGESRIAQDQFYSQPTFRNEERYFTLQDNEPWSLIRYFLDQGGIRKNLWISGAITETYLTSDVTASATSLPVADVTSRGANAFVVLDDGINRAPCKITANSGSNWTISAAIGSDFASADTQIFSLILARLSQSELTLNFVHDTLAQTTLKFSETPWETVTLSGETTGTTIGSTTQTAYLFTFSIDYPTGSVYYRYTDFERDLTFGGNTFTHERIESGPVQETLGLERQQATIKSRAIGTSPLMLFVPFLLEFPLMVEFCEVDVYGSTASNPRFYFYGEVTNVKLTGQEVQATCLSMPALITRKIPRVLVQPTCNFSVFDTGCGLSRSAFEHTANFVSSNYPRGWVWTVDTIAKGGVPQTSIPADFFTQGILFIPGTGQSRWITSSTAESGGQIQIKLSQAFAVAIAGSFPVKLYPGCDGRIETCTSKFSNRSRFGGFAFMPPGNPSFTEVKSNSTSGSKK